MKLALARGFALGAAFVSALLVSHEARAQESTEWREPVSDPEPTPEPAPEVPRVRGKEAAAALPGLEVRQEPPGFVWKPSISSNYPFQLYGAEIAFEISPQPWLSLMLLYSVGFGLSGHEKHTLNHYGEAFLGVRFLRLASERAVDLVPKQKDEHRAWNVPPPEPTLKVWYPSSHSFFVDAGMITGFTSFERCPGSCADVPDPPANSDEPEPKLPLENRQLFYLAGGLRYRYFVYATSKLKEMNRRMALSLWAQLISKPLNDDGHALRWYDEREVERAEIGWRAGADIPWGLQSGIQFNVMGGYLPMPASVLIGLGITVPLGE
jgi:hypothetical protein